MRCPECGTRIRKDARFCAKCGWKVIEIPLWKRIRIPLIVTALSLSVVLIAVLAIAVVKNNKTEIADEPEDLTEISVPEANENDGSPESDISETSSETGIDDIEALFTRFGISEENVADYGDDQVLDYNRYDRYTSEKYDQFGFSYPSSLYNNVSFIENGTDENYGNELEKVELSADDGSRAMFVIYENDNIAGTDIESKTENLHEKEKDTLFSPIDLTIGVSQNGDYGTVIMSGYENESMDSCFVYDLCHIDNEYLYRMRLTYPKAKDPDDDVHKAYYQMMMYCQCDFSGAVNSKPSPFNTFSDSYFNSFNISAQQKQIIWGLMKYVIYHNNMTGSKEKIAQDFADDGDLLQLYLYSDMWNRYEAPADSSGKIEYPGAIEYARSFYRDLLDIELDGNRIGVSASSYDPGDGYKLILDKDSNELFYAYGTSAIGTVSGNDGWEYNESLNCYDYLMGPIYAISPNGESWKEHLEKNDKNYGIYAVHIRPNRSNTLGFDFLGIDKVG
ncbi:MAG: zinc ribbon domain-containing protein [Lachnospiraceae bacterium]|nr:zinc ribbon domain-containing protein [Lachnospiraceae bacterium]